jgi:hypothetical protein
MTTSLNDDAARLVVAGGIATSGALIDIQGLSLEAEAPIHGVDPVAQIIEVVEVLREPIDLGEENLLHLSSPSSETGLPGAHDEK